MERMIRVERGVTIREVEAWMLVPYSVTPPPPDFVISTLVPASADRIEISKAVVALDRLAPLFVGICDGCGTPGAPLFFVHHPDCRYAPPNIIESCRAEMHEQLGLR